MIKKGQVQWLAKGDIAGQVRYIHQIFGIVAYHPHSTTAVSRYAIMPAT
jgi:hypothetical protein